jgi:anaerobic selenocysteine-containing dehydrogenase
MFACRCGIRGAFARWLVRFIDGNPDHPLNQGAAGAMTQCSPARLRKPLLRKSGSERGAAEFDEIEWSQAFDMLGGRPAHIRATDPNSTLQTATGIRHPNIVQKAQG